MSAGREKHKKCPVLRISALKNDLFETLLAIFTNMKQILFSAIVLALFITPVWTQKAASTDSKALITKQAASSKYENFDLLTEEFSFLIQDFKINHQLEVNNLNIKIRYRYENGITESEYPDFRAIVKDIEDFLNNYPNKTDYWEILNKKLTLMLLKKYPTLESITSEIQVSLSQKVAYLRSSIVSRNQSKRAKIK
jgi:hypothetical protein